MTRRELMTTVAVSKQPERCPDVSMIVSSMIVQSYVFKPKYSSHPLFGHLDTLKERYTCKEKEESGKILLPVRRESFLYRELAKIAVSSVQDPVSGSGGDTPKGDAT